MIKSLHYFYSHKYFDLIRYHLIAIHPHLVNIQAMFLSHKIHQDLPRAHVYLKISHS